VTAEKSSGSNDARTDWPGHRGYLLRPGPGRRPGESREGGRQVGPADPSSFQGTREPEIPQSPQSKRARRKGAAPDIRPSYMRGGSKPALRPPSSCRGRSRTYSSSRSMQIYTWFLKRFRDRFFSDPCPLTPRFAGGKLAALGPAASCQAFSLSVIPRGAAIPDSRRAPSLSLRLLDPVGLRQGAAGQ